MNRRTQRQISTAAETMRNKHYHQRRPSKDVESYADEMDLSRADKLYASTYDGVVIGNRTMSHDYYSTKQDPVIVFDGRRKGDLDESDLPGDSH